MKIPVKIVNADNSTETVNAPEQETQEQEGLEQPLIEPALPEAESEEDEQAAVTAPAAPPEEQPAEPAAPVEEPEDEVTRLTKALAAKTQEAKDHLDARLRLQAEFDNFKKRKEKELQDFRKYANEDLLQEMLRVADDFERAIASAEQTHKLEDFLKGIEMIFEKFFGVLKRKGIKEIEAQGQPFNPEIHEALMSVERDDVEEGVIVSVFQKGYTLHDRVIVAPKVGVSKKKLS